MDKRAETRYMLVDTRAAKFIFEPKNVDSDLKRFIELFT